MKTSPATSVSADTILEIISKAQHNSRHVYLIQGTSYGRALLRSRFDDLPKVILQEGSDTLLKRLLIALPEEKDFFPDFLPRTAKPCPCTLLISSRTAPELLPFLRHRLACRRHDGSELQLNFSAHTLSPLLEALSPQRAARFFGPAETLLWSEHDMHGKPHWHARSFPAQTDETFLQAIRELEADPVWQLTEKEDQSFQKHDRKRLLVSLCRELLEDPAFRLRDLPDEEILRRVDQTAVLAGTYGLSFFISVLFFCRQELTHFPGIHLHPKIAALFREPMQDPYYKNRVIQRVINNMREELLRYSKEYLETSRYPVPEDTLATFEEETARSCNLFRHALGALSMPAPWENKLLGKQDDAPDGFALLPATEKHDDSREEIPACPPSGGASSSAEELEQRLALFQYGLNCLSRPVFWGDRLRKQPSTAPIRACLDGFVLPALNLPPGTPPAGRVGLMCLLHFRGGHLAAVQEGLCECIREYASLPGAAARCGKIAAGRVMLAGARGLTLPDQARIRKMQEQGKKEFSCLISSSATREDYERQPPAGLLQARLHLNEMTPRAGKKTPPAPPPVPLDRSISTLAVIFPPSLFLLNAQPIPFIHLLCRWCERLQPVYGAAGWGIAPVCEPAQAAAMTPLLQPHLRRFPGLLPLSPLDGASAEPSVSVNWLTILGEEQIERIGGPERLAALGPDFPVMQYPGGHIIQAGPRPELGDSNRGELPRFYGNVQELLQPLATPQTL